MKVGDLVVVSCGNHELDKKIGTVMLHEKNQGVVYGLCVMIEGLVYGFKESEVEVVNESR